MLKIQIQQERNINAAVIFLYAFYKNERNNSAKAFLREVLHQIKFLS